MTIIPELRCKRVNHNILRLHSVASKYKRPMRILSHITLILIIGLSCACTTSDNQINNEFYSKLNEQLKSEYFSPIDFAEQFNPTEHLIDWQIIQNEIIAGKGEDQFQFRLSDLSFHRGLNHSVSKYTIHVHKWNKEKSSISSLVNGSREESKLNFELKEEGVKVSITPFKGFLKWDVVPFNMENIDSIVIEITADGPYYGGGERYIGTRLNGRTVSNQPNDHYWDPPRTETSPWGNPHDPGHYKPYEPSYCQIAFYLNPFGDAWFVDDAASVFGTFAENGEKIRIRIESNRTSFYAIHKKTAKEALTTYTAVAGRQPEIPDWAVGVWVNLLDGQDSVYTRANRLVEWGIPATAIWVFDMGDIPNSQGYENWTTGPYHSLKEMTDSLHKLGFKALSYLHPYQEVKLPKSNIDNPTYQKFDSLGLLLITPREIRNKRYGYDTSGLYNFHIPLMGDLWQEMLRNVLLRDGFDGYMEDFGDLSYCFDRMEIKWEAIDYGQETPLTPNQYNNSYPLVYHKLSYLQAREINPDIATFCRSGSLGSAAYTKILWGGDQMSNWDKTFGYPSVISSGISCGLSGFANWTPDILSSSPDMELWKRWVQFAAFTPIMRDHLWVNKPTSVDIWYNNETPEYFRRYAEIHMSMVPYIQEHLQEYRRNGVPLVRHMMLEFPDEPDTYDCEYQYMFGSKYLVAPVVDKGATEKAIYFPEGKWRSYWDPFTIDSDGEWRTVRAPVDTIPIFERLLFDE